MSYLDVNKVVDSFVQWRKEQKREIRWSGFHTDKINDVRRRFTSGEIKKDDVGKEVESTLNRLGVHLDSSDRNELDRIIKRY